MGLFHILMQCNIFENFDQKVKKCSKNLTFYKNGIFGLISFQKLIL